LTISVEDSGPGPTPNIALSQQKGAGVGLANVTRRLQLCFGPAAGVSMQQGASGMKAQFSVPLSTSLVHRAKRRQPC